MQLHTVKQVCPICRHRLVYQHECRSGDLYECQSRKCQRWWMHVDRHAGCGLVEWEDLPDPTEEHRFIQKPEPTWFACCLVTTEAERASRAVQHPAEPGAFGV